jgi:hypothetical protein
MLLSVDWLLVTDISGRRIVTILKGQADCFTLEYFTERLIGNVGNYQPMQRCVTSQKYKGLIYKAAELNRLSIAL